MAQQVSNVPDLLSKTNQFHPGDDLKLPAVSGWNGKLDYAGGEMDGHDGHNFDGSLSLPLTHALGFQADALYSHISDLNFYGGAGHLFWRQPEHGLIGLTGGYLYRDGLDSVETYQVGVEGELYWRQFTFGCFGGIGQIDYQYTAPFIDSHPTRFIGRVSADYYVLENLRLGASFTTAFENNLVKGQIEYQTPINGLALTAEAAIGDHDYEHWLLGVRYYFGGKKTLEHRHRQDDPPSLMPQILHSLGLYGAEYNHKEATFLAANRNSGNSGNSSSGGGDYGVIVITVSPGHGNSGYNGGYDTGITPPGSGLGRTDALSPSNTGLSSSQISGSSSTTITTH